MGTDLLLSLLALATGTYAVLGKVVLLSKEVRELRRLVEADVTDSALNP